MKRYVKILALPLLVPLFFVGAVYGAAAINSAINSPNLDAGLVGHYTFDGKDLVQNVADSSGSGNTGDLKGFTSTTTTAGIQGQALTFNGTSQYVLLNNTAGFPLMTSGASTATYSAWVRTTETGTDHWIADEGRSGNTIPIIGAIENGGTGRCAYRSDGNLQANVNGSITTNDGRWHLITCVYDGANINLYVDGVADGTPVAVPSGAITLTTHTVGALNRGTLCCWVNGSIDDARFYSRALSAAEVKQLYRAGQSLHPNVTVNPPNLDAGLVGHWTFDGKDLIQNATDSAGGHNGDLIGYSSGTTTVPGAIGQGLTFNGTTQYVNVPTNTALNVQANFTISVWLKPTSAANQPIVSKKDSSPFPGYELRWNQSNNHVCVDLNHGVNNWQCGTATPTIGQWHHVVWTYNGSVTNTYIDGVADLVNDAMSNTSAPSSPLRFGADSFDTQKSSSSIDDVRVYSRVLSKAEVEQLYQAGQTFHPNTTLNPPNLDSGLVGHWTFDGKDMIQNIGDTSGHGNNAFLTSLSSTSTAPGIMGQAFNFNGSDDGINLDYNSSIPAGAPFTISMWVKEDPAYDSTGVLMDKQTSGLTNDWTFASISEGCCARLQFDVHFTTTNLDLQTNFPVNISDRWHHVAAVYASSTSAAASGIFLDGAEMSYFSTQDGSGDPTDRTDAGLGIGDNYVLNSQPWGGRMDDVRLYNRALSTAEIKQLYDLGR